MSTSISHGSPDGSKKEEEIRQERKEEVSHNIQEDIDLDHHVHRFKERQIYELQVVCK